MRRAFLIALFALACHKPKPAAPQQLCGGQVCAAGETCLERASAPGVPACIAHDDCDARAPGVDIFGEALAAAGMTRCTALIPTDFLGPDTPQTVTEDVYRLPYYDALHHTPVQVPNWGQDLAAQLPPPMQMHSVSDAIAEAASVLGHPVTKTSYTHTVDATAPLVTAVADLIQAQYQTPDMATLTADAADVPLEIQNKVALLVYAASDATVAHDKAFANVSDPDDLPGCVTGMMLAGFSCNSWSPTDTASRALLATGIDWTTLYQAAYLLARAVEDSGLQSDVGAMGLSFDQPTPIGRIVLADAGEQTYDESEPPIAVLVDFGGNDTYRTGAGAATDATYSVALHVDLGGDDTYGYDAVPGPYDDAGTRLPSDDDGRATPGDVSQGETAVSLSTHPRQGAGIYGIGLLFDYSGNDTYTSLRMSQGYAALGVGVLADFAGDDTYQSEAASQGGAEWGIGLLLDASGNDTYKLYAYGQGFGFVGGFGALVDGDGTDVYFANPGDPSDPEAGDPLYYNPQAPGQANSSFAQGAGFGVRPSDPAYAGSMSGGLGLLLDYGDGDDTYTASVFGQGTGYWFGTGMLYDEGGDDQYDGKWYVRGSAAHFAIALFHDHAGNDTYGTGKVGVLDTSYGVGHDFSIGWLIDDAGDDVYNVSPLSLGSGNACGWGFFVDVSGNDQYAPAGEPTLGAFAAETQCSFTTGSTLGVFVDAGGMNTYTIAGKPVARQNTTTLYPSNPMDPNAWGVGIDGTGNVLIIP